MKFSIYFALTLVFILSCDEPVEPDPLLVFESSNSFIQNNEEFEIILKLNDNNTPIFGIYIKIDYESTILLFDDESGFSAGNYFGENKITFVHEENNSIFLTNTLIQGEPRKSGSGLIGTFTFLPKLGGTTEIKIDEQQLEFYDEIGEIIEIEKIQTNPFTVEVN